MCLGEHARHPDEPARTRTVQICEVCGRKETSVESMDTSYKSEGSMADAAEEILDVFGTWPSPMTGGKDEWKQFLTLFRSEISAIYHALGKADKVTQLEIGSVLRTGIRVLDGRSKLKQWKEHQERQWKKNQFDKYRWN